MASLLPRSLTLLRASRSIAAGSKTLLEQPFQTSRVYQRAHLSSRVASRRLHTSPLRRQYQTFDTGAGNPPVKIQIEQPPSLFRRIVRLTSRTIGGIIIVTFGSVLALVIYEPNMIMTGEMVRMAVLPEAGVSDERTLEIEAYIQNHPLIQEFRKDSSLVETRPHLDIPVLFRPNVLTAGVLTGPDRIAVPPIVFADGEGKKLYAIMHLGDALCGHPGIVHGGLLATLMDETLARCCFPALPRKVAMTANLDINYRAPCKANQYIIIKAETTKVEGRKAWVVGRLESLPEPEAEGDGKLLVEASVLMIEPKVIGPLMREVIPSKPLEHPTAAIGSA
ncbi:hypothetical protein ABW19_dt0205187 [Dactylella cylindrospora]|nr:hypothetical protein ABW19_dt0205187 [Dactylella cylindrospora]